MPQSQVALYRGDDRRANIQRALEQLNGIDLSTKQRVLIKPNFVSPRVPLAVTHADAVRTVLEFVRERYAGPIVIAEGPAISPASEGFELNGYGTLAQEFGASLLDLNHDEPVPVDVFDRRLRPLRLHLARTIVDSDLRISVGPPKTHDVVLVTLSLKNMIVGSLISRHTHGHYNGGGNPPFLQKAKHQVWHALPMVVRSLPPMEWLTFRAMSTTEPSDKMKMHQSYAVMNLNLALVAPLVAAHLAVIDGFEAMEGNGPTWGTPVPMRLALASTDALAADVVGTALMGFDADDIGHLHYLKHSGLGRGDLDQIDIVGNASLAECRRKFRPHAAHRRQRKWHLPQSYELLGQPAVPS